jgi:hypothetical protein
MHGHMKLENLTIITVTLHESTCSLLIMLHSFLFTINVSDKVCKKNKNTQFIFSYFLKMYLNEIMFENRIIHDKSQMKNLSLGSEYNKVRKICMSFYLK